MILFFFIVPRKEISAIAVSTKQQDVLTEAQVKAVVLISSFEPKSTLASSFEVPEKCYCFNIIQAKEFPLEKAFVEISVFRQT